MATNNIKADMLVRLLDASRQMAENRMLDPLLDYAMDAALELVDAEYGYLVLLNNDDTLDFRVKRDREGRELAHPEEQISQTILSKVIMNHEDLIIADAIVDPKFQNAASVKALQLRAVMCVPLISRGNTIGALYVENRSQKGIFDEDALLPLKYFASQAAVSIENAILNDELEARVAERTAELENALMQLEQSWTETVESNRMRSEFLSKVAHDIRSPLATVMSAMSLMEEGTFGELSEEQHDWITKSMQTLDHIARLTEDFFDFTRLQMGKLTLYPETINLNTYIRNLYKIGQGLPWPDGVQFELQQEDELPEVIIDPTRIQQVVMNLISNALKFTEKGTVTLFARYLKDDQAVIIGVQDTGPGIETENLDKIFQRFQQAGTTEMQKKGTGLGLAICRELVELHQGHISVESEPGRGSIFQFLLPIRAE